MVAPLVSTVFTNSQNVKFAVLASFSIGLLNLTESSIPILGIVVLLKQVLVSAIDNPILPNDRSLSHVPSTQKLTDKQ